jgi:uncharacterized membrane protein YedE/YeeE
MFEEFGFETLTPVTVSVIFALIIGLAFGAIGQHIQFCFRRGIVGEAHERKSARGVWFTALAAAVVGTQILVARDIVSFGDHRLFVSDLPIVAIIVGGLMFGSGMVLTRGCISRLTVLSGTGNTRALVVMIVFGIAAHATLKGVFAPLRVWLGSFTANVGDTVSFANLAGGATLWTAIIALAALSMAYKSGAKRSHLLLAVVLGLLVPLSWAGTGFILYDEFDPIPMQSLSFTSPSADLLFWSIASTAIPAGFGVGLIGGVILGSALASLAKGQFKWQSFENPTQTRRYLLGALLMGTGGVLAGGCTVGAGLSGIPTLSFAAMLTLIFIAVGALTTRRMLEGGTDRTPSFAH